MKYWPKLQHSHEPTLLTLLFVPLAMQLLGCFEKKKVNNSLRKTIINHLYSRHWEPSTQDYISLVLSWPSAFTDVYKQRPNEPNESLEIIEYSKSHLSIFIYVFFIYCSRDITDYRFLVIHFKLTVYRICSSLIHTTISFFFQELIKLH